MASFFLFFPLKPIENRKKKKKKKKLFINCSKEEKESKLTICLNKSIFIDIYRQMTKKNIS